MGLGRVIWTTLGDFGSHTTIGGLCNAGLANSRIRQVYWLIIFFVLFCYTITLLVDNVNQYLQYQVITSTDLSYSLKLEFPSVTICNQNRVHCQNVFEQILAIKIKMDGLNASLSNATSSVDNATILQNYAQTSIRYGKLDKIFMISGCQTQACDGIVDLLPAVRNASLKINDNMVMKMGLIRCNANDKACYYLLLMNQTANSTTNPSQSKITNTWNILMCNLDVACGYKQFGFPPGKAPNDFVDPIACRSPVQTTTQAAGGLPPPPLGRKKRQAGPDPGPAKQKPPKIMAKPDADFNTSAIFLKKYMELDEEDRFAIGHRLDNVESSTFGTIYGMLSSCSYKGRDCTNLSFWGLDYTPKYGNCFTFNSMDNVDRDAEVPRKASLTGRDYGVAISLFLDQENYMLAKLSKNAGAKLVLHDPSLPPLPDEYGIDMQPNTASSVAIQTTNILRQPSPYTSQCINVWDETGYDIDFKKGPNGTILFVNYSLASCQRYILQRDIAQACKCFHPNLFQSKIETTFGVPPCLITPDTPDQICLSGIIDLYNNGTLKTTCSVSCNETQFSASVSTSTWPSDQYWKLLALDIPKYRDIINTVPPEFEDVIKTRIQRNYAMAEVYFQTLNVVNINQSPALDTNGLISALGGSLGLFTGIAIIMIFEILELAWDIFYNIWTYMTAGGPKGKKKAMP